jgi:Tfp pilus assembly protein PilN
MNKPKLPKKMPSKKDYLKKEINLLPEDISQRKKRKIRIFSYAFASILIISLMAGYNYRLDKTIEDMLGEKATIEAQIEGLTVTENEQLLIFALNSKIDEKANEIKAFELITPKAIPIINVLENTMPEGVSLSSLNRTEAGVSIIGVTDSRQSVAEYLHNLKNEDMFDSVVVNSISADILENGSSKTFRFSIDCKFKTIGGEEDDSI